MTITLATLSRATEQEVFDQVATHLLKQNQKATVPGSSHCRYRAGELSCAAGCLISDDEYNKSLEVGTGGGGWTVLVDEGAVPDTHKRLIQALQTVHDGYTTDLWRFKLEKVAVDYGLEWKH